MYWRLSTSKMREPCAVSMNRGVPPTALNARTGEFTPPGMTSCARWKRASDCLPMPARIIRTASRGSMGGAAHASPYQVSDDGHVHPEHPHPRDPAHGNDPDDLERDEQRPGHDQQPLPPPPTAQHTHALV